MRTHKTPIQQRYRILQRYDKLKQSGLCVTCGRNKPRPGCHTNGMLFSRCDTCIAKQRASEARIKAHFARIKAGTGRHPAQDGRPHASLG